MPATTVRSLETFQTVHTSDSDWQDVVRQWMATYGIEPELIDDLIADMGEKVKALGHNPWLVLTPQGIIPVDPATFSNGFEDIAATDVLNDIWMERQSHLTRGYDARHDDSHPTAHLVNLAVFRAGPIANATNTLPDAVKREELVKAASLIVAAIDKIDRAQAVRTFSVD